MRLTKGTVFFISGFYLFLVIPVILAQYFRLRNAVIDGLNRDLYTAARDMGDILDEDFYEIWNPENPLPEDVYERIKEQLNVYTDHFEIEYAYSMVKRGDEVYFVVSNETEEDIARGTPSLFYNPYPDPPEDVLRAFETDEPFLSSSYTNIWDSYYSFFLPRRTASGLVYVLAADVKMDFRRKQLNDSLILLAVMIFVMVASLLPFFVIRQLQTRRRSDSLREQLYRDLLTGLPNRTKFMEDHSTTPLGRLSAVMFDLDSFREVNNLFGGRVGDLILAHTMKIIQKGAPRSRGLYKFPADEFVLVLDDLPADEVVLMAERILKSFDEESFITEGQALNLSLRAGIVHNPPTRKALLSSLNITKNMAKNESRSYLVYDDSLDQEESYAQNFFWLSRIKEALEEDRVVPFFQPIMNNFTGEIERYEALIRMMDREGRPVPPGRFLSIAMKSKLYKELTKVMVRKSLAAFAERPEMLSLNFSNRDLLDRETMDFLFQQVEKWKLENRVIIEILESESLFQIQDLTDRLDECRRRGVLIGIDDFGSGYSNFSYLSRVPLNLVKIDGTMIRGLTGDSFSEAVVASMAAFCHDLDIPLVAEYVEDEATRSKLISMGIQFSQGYHIGRPVPFEELKLSSAEIKTDPQ